jgi:hypothetical protein
MHLPGERYRKRMWVCYGIYTLYSLEKEPERKEEEIEREKARERYPRYCEVGSSPPRVGQLRGWSGEGGHQSASEQPLHSQQQQELQPPPAQLTHQPILLMSERYTAVI